MLVFRAGIHKMLGRIANREDPDHTALKQSELSPPCLSRGSLAGKKFQILEHLFIFVK